MCDVPAGPFCMGCNSAVDTECHVSEKPYHQVTVLAFKIDRYDVTAAEYKSCVDAGACTVGSPYGTCNYGVSGEESHPIGCADWIQARTYCTWAGKRLPNESEWEKAARGTDGRKYPWGNDSLDCDHAVWCEDRTYPYFTCGCGNGGTMPVGQKPKGASPYGVEDMIGNVWEWVVDADSRGSFNGAPIDGSTWIDNPCGDGARVIRGGSWDEMMRGTLRASYRGCTPETYQGVSVGFRCAFTGIWMDSSTGLMWQNPATNKIFQYDGAVSYCNGLSLAGYEDWRLPTISELRTLIRGCPNTQTGGVCGVTDQCLQQSCWDAPRCGGCTSFQGPSEGGCYWNAALSGSCDWWYWSSSHLDATTDVWIVNFNNGGLNATPESLARNIRCVRSGP